MSDNRARQLMQDALDGELSEQKAVELDEILQSDPAQAAEYDAQQRVDGLLRYPPMERAPQRLGMMIMGRIGQMLAQHQQAQGIANELTEAQLQIAVQLVTVAAMPMLAGAGFLLLNAQSDPEAAERALMPALALLVMMIDAMTIMLEQAEAVYEEDPELALAMLTLMPAALLLLVREILETAENEA